MKINDGPPRILASQLFFLFDEKPAIAGITDNMTSEMVVVEVGKILHSKQRLLEDVGSWAKELFKQAGLPFNLIPKENCGPVASLSVVPSQPESGKTKTLPTLQKRKTRRIYLELAIQHLERGCTHRSLVDAIMKRFPDLNRETVSTFVSDVQNPRYSPIKDGKVVKQADGTLIFEDKIRPALTVIENPNFAGAETEPVTEAGKKASSSMGDV
ncbi:MAG: hypothetical protein ACLP29_08060 [Dissulfurispiraceae bacterium]